MLVTLARAPLGAMGVLAIWAGAHELAVVLLVIFAAVDLVDGVVARSRGEETGVRRIVDVVIDRATIAATLIALSVTAEVGLLAVALVISRDVLQGLYSGSFTLRFHTVVVGPHWHMSYGLAMLVWVCVVLFSGTAPGWLSALAATVAVAALADFVRRCERVARDARCR